MCVKADVCWPKPLKPARLIGGAVAVLALASAAGAAAKDFSDWSAPVSAESLGSSPDVNTASNDGCPILSPYDGSLYMASNRPGGEGGLDIWIAPKSGVGWGTPVNAGSTINTSADEFCPTPARGNRFYFVRRGTGADIGDTDIYVVKKLPTGWGEPQRLPKGLGQINSDHEEWSPSVYEAPDGTEVLYFASTRESAVKSGPTAKQKIYYSVNFGAAQLAQGDVNDDNPAASDARPNVRRDGLEIVWDSTRGAPSSPPDIWSATRSSVNAPWGTAVQLGNGINSPAGESRPSLSWDGTTLLFGSSRSGGEGVPPTADIYVSTREKITGND